MHSLFRIDSPAMRFLARVADLMLLNVLILVFSIPIVTTGAALSAAHHTALKLRREEGHIISEFIRSFRTSFKQATGSWLICLAVVAAVCLDLVLTRTLITPLWIAIRTLLIAVAVLTCMVSTWFFSLVAIIQNTFAAHLRNSFGLTLGYLPRSIMMALLYIAPWWISYWIPEIAILLLLFSTSVPVYLSTFFYLPVYKKMLSEEDSARL